MSEKKPEKITTLLAALDEAFATAETKAADLTKAQAAASKAVSEAQVAFETVKAAEAKKLAAATEASEQAKTALSSVQAQVNARISPVADPRVSVR